MSKKATIKKLTKSLLLELRGGGAAEAAPAKGKGKPKPKPAKGKPLTSAQVGALDGAANSSTVPSTKKAGPSTPFTCNTGCYDPNKTKAVE